LTTHQQVHHGPPPPPRRGRRGLLIGVGVALVVLVLAGAAVATVFLTTRDGDPGPAYTQRDKICDLLDVGALAPLSLRERTVAGRTTARGTDGGDGDDPFTGCTVQLDLTAPGAEPGAYDLRAGVTYHRDAAAARAGYAVERGNADSIEGAVRTDAPGVGDEGYFATSVLKAESDGVRSTLTTFHVVARHRNVVVEVNVGMVRDSDWNQAQVRDILSAIARGLLAGL
jgi:hypothetical protein